MKQTLEKLEEIAYKDSYDGQLEHIRRLVGAVVAERHAENNLEWWPENPYPENIFTMTMDEYVAAVPDGALRTAISGCLGRYFWDLASWEILRAIKTYLEDVQDAN